MNVYDLIPRQLLEEALERGFVRKQTHPELPLAILNYTERAAYDGVWNEATLNCRGLIYDVETGRIVARPFPKFFNYGQPGAPELDLDAPAIVTEKMDGSLGILWQYDGVIGIATRGSFLSEQALHAMTVLALAYGTWRPSPGLTYLFEIVYPENRIVCDYGDLDDLVLLDIIENRTGESVVRDESMWSTVSAWRWPGPTVETHPYRTLAEALTAEPRPNAEGFVVFLPDAGARVKIKQEDYVALHRIVTRLNKRTVWQHLDEGKPLADLVAPLPDEFRPWVEDVAAELAATVAEQARQIEQEYEAILEQLGPGWSRREFAGLATKSVHSWALFLRLDGRDYGPKLWHRNRPEAETPTGRAYSEDVA